MSDAGFIKFATFTTKYGDIDIAIRQRQWKTFQIIIVIIITEIFSGISSNATTRTTIVRVIQQMSRIRECCNSSGISVSTNGAGRLTGTERR